MEIEENKLQVEDFAMYSPQKCSDVSSKGDWVVKKHQESSIKTVQKILKISVQAHTRKQVQIHALLET